MTPAQADALVAQSKDAQDAISHLLILWGQRGERIKEKAVRHDSTERMKCGMLLTLDICAADLREMLNAIERAESP